MFDPVVREHAQRQGSAGATQDREVTFMRQHYSFRLILDGPRFDAAVVGRLSDACGEEALFSEDQGVKIGEFERAADSFEAAVMGAIALIEGVDSRLLVVRAEPDDLVTASGIAARTGRSRQSVAQLASGLRGRGDFPAPVSTADGRTRIWRWTDVRGWFGARGGMAPPDARRAHFMAALNGALDLRRHSYQYREQGGDREIAAAVERLARSATSKAMAAHATSRADAREHAVAGVFDNLPALAGEPVRSATVAAREVVRRARSHVVFLTASLLSELSTELARERSELATWLDNAVDAHDRSVQYRLTGNLSKATTSDREVFENLCRVLRAHQAVPLRVPHAGRGAIVSPRGSRIHWVGRKILDADACFPLLLDDGAFADRPYLANCVDVVLAPKREPRGDIPLRTVCRILDESCRRPVDSDALGGAAMYYRWDVDLSAVDLTAPSTVRRAYEDSAVGQLVSSWFFASTVQLLTQRYLPKQIGTADDVVVRLEDELAACAA